MPVRSHTEKPTSGYIPRFVTCQAIVCRRCGQPATHGAAVVDSRIEWPGDAYPMYSALLFCTAHAARDYYAWPALASVERVDYGRTEITITGIDPATR